MFNLWKTVDTTRWPCGALFLSVKSLGRCIFKSPKCKCWNLSQLSLQGGILGRFLLGFSQCNSRVPDWIPARCFEAPLSPQNGFKSLLEPSLCLTTFLLKRLTYSAIKSHKKNLIWSQSGPSFETKVGPRIGTKIGTRLGTQIGPWIGDQKGGQNWKTHFGNVLKTFLEANFGSSFGTKFRQIHTEFRVSSQHCNHRKQAFL